MLELNKFYLIALGKWCNLLEIINLYTNVFIREMVSNHFKILSIPDIRTVQFLEQPDYYFNIPLVNNLCATNVLNKSMLIGIYQFQTLGILFGELNTFMRASSITKIYLFLKVIDSM